MDAAWPSDARLLKGWRNPSALYDALVGDDPLGFWWDAVDGTRRLSYLGSGRHVSRSLPPAPPPGQAPAWRGPGRFGGGWIGWADYESGASSVTARRPGGTWLRVDNFVALDVAERRIWAVAPRAALDGWAAQVESALTADTRDTRAERAPAISAAIARNTPAEYAALVERAREYIRRGEAYQLCLTTRFTVRGTHDPRVVHERMRSSRARNSALIRAGATSLVAASPETFLDVDATGRVRTSPIKGTRPRAADEAEDARLGAELLAHPKERAENLMIVDLMRNDLSRVCEIDSVRVDRLFHLETHTHVHQLVSEISGQLASGNGVSELISSCFPAGSMTGAPKRSAMTILARLEAGPRGVYAGCFGWIGDDGAALLAMTIRCAVITPTEAYVGAGGGLTIDSETAFEVSEVALKAAAPLRALGARIPDEWRSFVEAPSVRAGMM
ncbi:anthranilate synthase component 1 [Paramicrobacterium humi]|uniref:Anthranilate synthase component 1 n=1 Tax=Paramicrobacterium humi TaxID=640635 RepID=A0A1H4QA91_9MICO|nr:anthranilate synthase component I family protein [Microbacterium humi]SEC16547.1 anthranilate synthase component 1 [Microbacterium humi]